MFTCCVSTQTLERVMLLYIQHNDGQSSQQGGRQLNHYILIILLLLAGNSTQGAWRSPVGTTFPLCFCRHYKAEGSRSAPHLACSRAHCTLLSSAACCCQPSLCPSAVARLWCEQSPSNLCPSSDRKSSPFANQSLLGGIYISVEATAPGCLSSLSSAGTQHLWPK